MSTQFVRWKYPSNDSAAGAGLWWKRLSFVLTVLILALLFNVIPGSHNTSQESAPSRSQKQFGNPDIDNEAVDGLSNAQCRTTFPDLFADIDRAVAYWKSRDYTISKKDIDLSNGQSAMRILVHDNELRILESRNAIDYVYSAPDRAYGVLSLIQQALDTATAIGKTLPTIEASLNFQDDALLTAAHETSSFWSFSRSLNNETHQRLWIMPNYDFWFDPTTGPFADAKRNAVQHDASFDSKIPQIVWRGSVEMNPELRGGLVQLTQGKDWADIVSADGREGNSASLKVDQFCKYAATVHTEGVTYSGRLAFLTNCKSLLFVHDLEFATHFSHLLVKAGPDQNHVPVQRDWSDLEEKVTYYLDHDHQDEAEAIIANNLATFRSRYTTRAATSCYLRQLILGFSSVAFEPETTVRGEGSRRRGVSFAQIMQTRHDGNFELGVEYEKGRPDDDERP